MSDPHAREVASGERFAFGANWRLFLAEVDRGRIDQAKATLADMLETKDLAGKRFLDIGCGSGVMSLAASELGADVVSFDFDPDSVACAVEIKNRYRPDATTWRIERGSALDGDYLKGLGTFDVVYSWGVLHHTGAMHAALENAAGAVAPGGRLFIAIYNDQGWISRYWAAIKGLYNRHPWSRPILILLHWPYLVGLRLVYRALTGRGGLERGMSLMTDLRDWLGGWPFEVAKPEAMLAFHRRLGFRLLRLVTCGGRHGCNEFVFDRPA